MGSLHNIDSVCSGRAGAILGRKWVPGTGSGNWFREPVLGDRFCRSREPVPGFDGFRQVLRFQEIGFRTPRFRAQKVACPRVRRFPCSMGCDGLGSVLEVWTEPALGTRFRKPEILRRFRVPEILFPRFRTLLSPLKGHFCTLKVYFCTRNVYEYSESPKVYFCTFKALKVDLCTLEIYFCTLKVYLCTLKIYLCILKVYFVLGKCTFVL